MFKGFQNSEEEKELNDLEKTNEEIPKQKYH